MSRHCEAQTALEESLRLLGLDWKRAEVRELIKIVHGREAHAKRQCNDSHTPQSERAGFQRKEIFWRRQRLVLETLQSLLKE